MVEDIRRNIGKLIGRERNPHAIFGKAWAELGGETGEDVTLTQIKKVVRAEIEVKDWFVRVFGYEDDPRAREASAMRVALDLRVPHDYDVLIEFFAKQKAYYEAVVAGTISEGSRFGRPFELVRRRSVQSRSAVDYLEAVKTWGIRDDGNTRMFGPKSTN